MGDDYSDIDYKKLTMQEAVVHAYMLQIMSEDIDKDPHIAHFVYFGLAQRIDVPAFQEIARRRDLVGSITTNILHKRGLSEIFMEMQDCTPANHAVARKAFATINKYIHAYRLGKYKPDPMPE